jgi:hypothetical protein
MSRRASLRAASYCSGADGASAWLSPCSLSADVYLSSGCGTVEVIIYGSAPHRQLMDSAAESTASISIFMIFTVPFSGAGGVCRPCADSGLSYMPYRAFYRLCRRSGQKAALRAPDRHLSAQSCPADVKLICRRIYYYYSAARYEFHSHILFTENSRPIYRIVRK